MYAAIDVSQRTRKKHCFQKKLETPVSVMFVFELSIVLLLLHGHLFWNILSVDSFSYREFISHMAENTASTSVLYLYSPSRPIIALTNYIYSSSLLAYQ
jgi:hypothetical protein